MREVLCSAVYKFSVYVLTLSITFDTEERFIALWNFVFFQSSRFLLKVFVYRNLASLADAHLARHAMFPPQREEPKETKGASAREINRSQTFSYFSFLCLFFFFFFFLLFFFLFYFIQTPISRDLHQHCIIAMSSRTKEMEC